MPQLLDNATTDGDGAVIDWNGNGTPGTLQLSGLFAGATVTIKGSIDGGNNFLSPSNGSFKSELITCFEMAPGKVKATISGATGATNISADVSPG